MHTIIAIVVVVSGIAGTIIAAHTIVDATARVRRAIRRAVRINRSSVSARIGRTRIVVTRTPAPATMATRTAYAAGYRDAMASIRRSMDITDDDVTASRRMDTFTLR